MRDTAEATEKTTQDAVMAGPHVMPTIGPEGPLVWQREYGTKTKAQCLDRGVGTDGFEALAIVRRTQRSYKQ